MVTFSTPYIAVAVGPLPSGMTSVNIRFHDEQNGTNTDSDKTYMRCAGSVIYIYTDEAGILQNHTYTIYMSANGASGYVQLGCKLTNGVT